MDNLQKIILLSLISTSVLGWIGSEDQPDMTKAMTTFDPLSISFFTASWTVGMAAMMLPAIVPWFCCTIGQLKTMIPTVGAASKKESTVRHHLLLETRIDMMQTFSFCLSLF